MNSFYKKAINNRLYESMICKIRRFLTGKEKPFLCIFFCIRIYDVNRFGVCLKIIWKLRSNPGTSYAKRLGGIDKC